MIRSFVLAAIAVLLPLLSYAETAAPYREGLHYVRLDQPVRPRKADKIEVVEVFWYGCPHCFHFEPLANAWKKRQPADVDFWLSPVIWNDTTAMHARAFYVAQALGVQEKLHIPLFEAITAQSSGYNTKAKLAALFAANGVDAAEFDKAFNVFGVNSQVEQARTRTLKYRIEGTPELVVAGKYRVTGRGAGTQEEMLKVVDYLIAKERKERGQSPKSQ